MRRIRLVILVLVACSLTAVGCSQEASQHAAAQQKLEQALAVMTDAERGYAEVAGSEVLSVQAYRQSKLAEAQSQLDEVVKMGSADQQVAARMLIAQINASAARHALRDGLSGFAPLRVSATGGAMSLRLALEEANARAMRYDRDEEPGRAIMTEAIGEGRTSMQQVKSDKESLATALQNGQGTADKHTSTASRALAEEQKLRSEAFVLKGDQHYDLHGKADKAELRAIRAQKEAELARAVAAKDEKAVELAQAELAGLNEMMIALEQELESSRGIETKLKAEFDAARAAQVDLGDQMTTDYSELLAKYDSDVREPFETARSRSKQAVKALEPAVAAAKSGMDLVQSELLAARVTQSMVLTQYANTLAGMLSLTDALAARGSETLTAAQRQQLAEARKQLSDGLAAVVAEGRESISAGQTLATELASGSGDLSTYAAARAKELRSYESQLGSATN